MEGAVSDNSSKKLGTQKLVKFHDVVVISAMEQQGTGELKQKLRETLDFYADIEHEKTRPSVFKDKHFNELQETDRNFPPGQYLV